MSTIKTQPLISSNSINSYRASKAGSATTAKSVTATRTACQQSSPLFSGRIEDRQKELEEKVRKEAKRLSSGSFLPNVTGFLMTPVNILVQLLLPTTSGSVFSTLLGNFLNIFYYPLIVCKERAWFNVTKKSRNLNSFLPYKSYIQHGNDWAEIIDGKLKEPISIKEYEKLVQKILEKIDVRESSYSQKKLNKTLYKKAYKNPEYFSKIKGKSIFSRVKWLHDLIVDIKLPITLSFPYLIARNTLYRFKSLKAKKREEEEAKLLESYIKFSSIEPYLKASKDASSSYLIAASLVEAFHNRLDIIDRIINRDEPLHFVIANDKFSLAGGFASPKIGLISLNPANLWVGKTIIPIHEVIHVLSLQDGEIKGTLPEMTEEDTKEFTKARKKLFDMFDKNDATILGRLWTLITGRTSTGLRNYAFTNEQEFLPETATASILYPGVLHKTKAGRAIDRIWRRFLNPDKKVPQEA